MFRSKARKSYLFFFSDKMDFKRNFKGHFLCEKNDFIFHIVEQNKFSRVPL